MATTIIINETFDPHLLIEKEDFPDLCRVCMSKNKNMKSILNTELRKTAEEFEFCTGVLISEQDGLPTLMCDTCFDNLSVAHKFKNACLYADKVFKKILSQQALLSSIEGVKDETDDSLDDSICQSQDFVAKSETLVINYDDDDDDDDDNLFCQQDDEETKPISKLKSKSKEKGEVKEQYLVEITKKYICEECGLKYLSKSLLMQHKLEVHEWKSKAKPSSKKPRVKKANKTKTIIENIDNPKNETQSCNICKLNFQSRNLMLKHKLTEHNIKEWICEVCGKQFARRSSLKSHVRCHQPPTCLCPHCDYRSWYKSDLAKHLRTHTGEKNYVCEYCTQSFHTVSNMYEHIRRHHKGGFPVLPCPRCNRIFTAYDKLKRHIDSHDNIKRHECLECHTRFTRRCHWKDHLLKQHGIMVPRLRPGRRRGAEIINSDIVIPKI